MSRRGFVVAAAVLTVPMLVTVQMNVLNRIGDPDTKKSLGTFISLQVVMLVTGIIALIHFHLYRKIIAYTFVHKDHPKALYLFSIIAILSCLSFFLSKFLAAPETSPLAHVAFALFGWSVLTVFAFGVVDLLFLAAQYSPLPTRSPILAEVAKNRRKATIALALSSIMTVAGLLSAASPPVLVHTEVYLEKFPCSMNGFTIVQISDTHLGNTFPRSKFVDIVNRVNELKPDLVALTGDLIDAKLSPLLLPILEPLGWLNTKYGVYFVTGNHEYLAGSAVEWAAELSDRKIHFLHNSHKLISTETGSFIIAGVDDISGGMVHGHGHSLVSALAGVDTTKEIILLAHQPLVVEEAATRALVLSSLVIHMGGRFGHLAFW